MADLSQIKEETWQVAAQRAKVIRPLAEMRRCPQAAVCAAATELGISVRHVYTLIQRFRNSEGATTSLVPGVSNGGKGNRRLSKAPEDLLQTVINEVYLTKQRLTPEAVIRETRRRCLIEGLKAPSASTIRRRIKDLSQEDMCKRQESKARPTVVCGRTPAAPHPLETVQMDHTKVDVILVDPVNRKPIGRPWLTVAIDVFSRCIAGMYLSLEAPSATSVGLCLVHVASDKTSWLARHGITAGWPIHGKPERIAVDNGSEFHSAAFERGCEQHGIAIDWRPPGQPQFGGIVERVIGTLMKFVHEIPGTTFSNPVERGDYDSDGLACLTLEELEHWLAKAITGVYHNRPHAGVGGDTPLNRYQAGMQSLALAGKPVRVVTNPRTFLIDFLPVMRRTIQRDGITADHITYYSPALKPWILRRDPTASVLIRRDPRDISRIYAFDPDQSGYLEIPYRDLSLPSISLWEHRMALRHLRDSRQGTIDEKILFQAVRELRDIERAAAVSTRAARRNQTRRQQIPPKPQAQSGTRPSAPEGTAGPILPFSEIEEW